MASRGEHKQWPLNANAVIYELRSLNDEATHEAPSLAFTTRAMRGNIQSEKDVEGHEEYFSDEGPHLSDLERVARQLRGPLRHWRERMRLSKIKRGHPLFMI